jgi:hypothetical protein
MENDSLHNRKKKHIEERKEKMVSDVQKSALNSSSDNGNAEGWRKICLSYNVL